MTKNSAARQAAQSRKADDSTWKRPAAHAAPSGAKPAGAARRAPDPYDDPFATVAPSAPRRISPRKAPANHRAPTRRAAGAKKAARAPMDDPYDLLIARAEAEEKARHAARSAGKSAASGSAAGKGAAGGGGRKRRRGGWLTFMLSALIALCLMVGAWQLFRYQRFLTMREAVSTGTFFEGTWVDGVDVSNMTLEDALNRWETQIEPAYSGRTVTLDDGSAVTAKELGYESDYAEVLNGVWHAQQDGTLEQRYQNLAAQRENPSGHGVERTFYTDEAVSAYVDKLAEGIDTKLSEATVTGFDVASQTFSFSEGTAGKTLEREALSADIKAALDAGGGSVTRQITVTYPSVTAADIEASYGLRASATTNASSSSSNRLTNISLSLAAINGLVLKPGEEFSFNGVVGQRTAERGYKMAAAYSGGEVTEELGGGICQVSTTLFNAAVKADLEITERNAHSMPVSYVDKGKDATVNWGSQDLKFKNNTDAPIYIVAVLTDEKRVKIGIFGLLIEDGKYITVKAEVTETIHYDTSYQTNAFLLPGQTNVIQEGRTGYKATAYKIWWAADGTQLSKEVLCKSVYAKRDAIIEVAP